MLAINAEKAIYHQWKMLVESGCINNFRITAREAEGIHVGWFFADSDAYKWLDAASRIYGHSPSPTLKSLIDDFLSLLELCQTPDGYLYTYNQLNFPASRWENLLIEHELYCLGHLIEACVSNYHVTHETRPLSIATKVADLLVSNFLLPKDLRVDGHEEIEIALMNLYEITRQESYLSLARSFLERRGRLHPLALTVLLQNLRSMRRKNSVRFRRETYQNDHPDHVQHQIPAGNIAKTSLKTALRWVHSALSGKYFQTHKPIRQQSVPVGHAVRFGYLETGIARLARLTGDRSLLPGMQQAWTRMVRRRMYVNGGLGSLAGMEGFGRDYELHPEYAYAETCAAIASLFWNWEMTQLTGDAKYVDLFEWQLYNAALPGMGADGCCYLYNNPLLSRKGITRRPWFAVPCCPSNLSRVLASLGEYLITSDANNLWIHQYIGCGYSSGDDLVHLEMDSGLPNEGNVVVRVTKIASPSLSVHLRIPSWTSAITININGNSAGVLRAPPISPGTGSIFENSRYFSINRQWNSGDEISITFSMEVKTHLQPGKRGQKGKVALSRGPMLFCLESVDNPVLDILDVQLDRNSITPHLSASLMGGTQIISGQTVGGEPLVFIPYYLWANRGESQMGVWVNDERSQSNAPIQRIFR